MPEYTIPENEVDNFVSLFWTMLRELESKAELQSNPNAYEKRVVEGGYALLRRAKVFPNRQLKASWDQNNY